MSYFSKPLSELTPKEREEMMKRSNERRRELEESRRSMNPDRDFTWENTKFEDYGND